MNSDVARDIPPPSACAEITALTESWERQRGQAKLPLVVPMEGCADKTSLRTDPSQKGLDHSNLSVN